MNYNLFCDDLSETTLLMPSTLHHLFLYYQISSSWSSSSAVCVSIRAGVTRRTSPSCPCVAGRGTSCAAMTDLWSSPTCCRAPQGRRASWETRSCCRTAAGPRSWLSRSAPRRFTCILPADECTTPAQSGQAASAWSAPLWPSSSARSLFMLRSRANQGSPHTSCGEGSSTHWPMSLQEASPQQRRAAGRREEWDNVQVINSLKMHLNHWNFILWNVLTAGKYDWHVWSQCDCYRLKPGPVCPAWVTWRVRSGLSYLTFDADGWIGFHCLHLYSDVSDKQTLSLQIPYIHFNQI